MSHSTKRAVRRLAVAFGVATLPLSAQAQSSGATGTADLQRGAYLTHAADCQACHSRPNGPAYAGGRAFVLPMGTLYSPNITPDRDTGIGRYTDDEWVRMLRGGIARDGKHLYPAMPYDAYAKMSRDDALAIKAYLFSLAPVHAAVPADHMKFPYNYRILMVGWNLLNYSGKEFTPDASKPAAWNRGAYLVEALGHCQECHTPRTFSQGLDSAKAFGGAEQQGWLAYNISGDPDHGVGHWTDDALEHYLASGEAPGHGPASGPMAEAVEDSLRYLTPADIHAMVVYLRGIAPQPDGPDAVGAQAGSDAQRAATVNGLGYHVFQQACAGCHLPNGQGRQSAWAALGGSHSTGDPDGGNLVQVLGHGTQIETPQGLMFMHSFTRSYTDEELAAVGNYVVAQFGGRQGHITPEQIRHVRSAPPEAPPAKSGS